MSGESGIVGKNTALIASLAIGFVGIVGYAIYFDRRRRKDPKFRRNLLQKEPNRLSNSSSTNQITIQKQLELNQTIDSSAATTTTTNGNSILHSLTTTTTTPQKEAGKGTDLKKTDVDLSIDQILSKSLEERQLIFQNLLIFGETLISVETKPTIAKGIEYLYKALNLVPNPTELLLLFQKTLPKQIFDLVVEKIELESRSKITNYYDKLIEGVDQKGSIVFKQDLGLVRKDVAIQNSYLISALKSFQPGEVIFEERLDKFFIAAPTVGQLDDKHCNYCCELLSYPVNSSCNTSSCCSVKCACPDCGVLFCNEGCLERAQNEYHKYLCCPESKKLEGFTLFIAKYLSLMLHEELKGNSSLKQGPFMHYDFMQKFSPSFTKKDVQEATLLRSIFSSVNPNMLEFLTDERYAAMKGTLMLNTFCIIPNLSTPSNNNALVGGGATANNFTVTSTDGGNMKTKWNLSMEPNDYQNEHAVYCLFNLACHLIEKLGSTNQQSTANVKLEIELTNRKLYAIAASPIQKGEFLKC